MADIPAGSVSIEDDGPVLRAVVTLPGCTAAQALGPLPAGLTGATVGKWTKIGPAG